MDVSDPDVCVMNLTISQVVHMWEHVKFGDHNYTESPRTYGEARYVLPFCGMEIRHAKLVTWGPIQRWYTDYPDRLEYDRVEIHHDQFYAELEAPYNTLLYYCKHRGHRSMSHAYFRDKYDLDSCGDVSYLSDVITYLDLIRE
jgi:hypothetical protein